MSPTLALGCASLGNLYRAIDDERATATVDAAWDAGIRYFDTAPHYGLGLSERRLGAALADRPRASYTVSTKVGRMLEPVPGGGDQMDDGGFAVPATHRRVWDFSRDGVRRCLDESLDRLGLDRIDLVLLHDPEDHADQAIAEGYPALAELRDQGVVGAIGTGSKDVPFLTRFVTECEPDEIIVAGRYTLLEQPALDTILPACAAAGTAVLNAGVFNSGLLAVERPHAGLPYEYGPAPAAVVERAAAIAEVCVAHGTTLPAAALAFAGSHPVVRSVIVGADSPDQVRRNAALFGTPPPAELWPALVEAGLLDPRVLP
ncbi:oxidoreductase [Asanoa ishikariensis]|uniref:D-threo-aldose 1-dehydrogenase n=1 Tax=Asanoa ishikariensis TaxID=137265 RepID=A0A1H3LM81_9ACTN|nr:aldo/keto reductase [Asanoa ishikariensis]GIF65573.1 oxidoreductase [Asanoa ishikariensis]SDY65552.1 D-threo-aldose 1-dehydrogenase [Asanoa ishikariensis]